MNLRLRRPELMILLLSLLFFIPFLGSTPLFDWDEINFAECAREMIATGDYSTVSINYQPFWEKPPLFIWMQVLSMKIFGINEFGARFPNVICGVITLLVLFRAGKRLYDEKMGLLWSLCYGASLLPHLYFKSGIIDPWFNLFIFLSFYYFYLAYSAYKTSLANNDDKRFLAVAGLFLGLAVLTKGPVAIAIAGICFVVFFVIGKFKSIISFKGILILIFTTASIGGLWFLLLYLSGNGKVIAEFIDYQLRLASTQDAGHGGPFYYHFIVLLVGCFPASIVTIRSFGIQDSGRYNGFKLWMSILFWVTLITFSIVKTKIIHYSSLCYFPLTFLAAYGLYQVIKRSDKLWRRWMSVSLIIIGAIYGILLTAIPFVMPIAKKMAAEGKIKDVFTAANLQADISWHWFHALPGIGLLVFLILASRYFYQKNYIKGYFSISLGLIITLLGAAAMITPRVEQISQHAAIEFYQSKQKEDAYFVTIGFKSYAHLFYSRVRPYTTLIATEENVMSNQLDKTAYLVSKNKNKEEFQIKYPDLILLYEKNGFVFFKREAVISNDK